MGGVTHNGIYLKFKLLKRLRWKDPQSQEFKTSLYNPVRALAK